MQLQNKKARIPGFLCVPLQLPLWVILLVGFVNGLIYIFVVPPWQHYDEPGHFEYAWLLAHHALPITEATADLQLRSTLIDSMTSHEFFRGMPINPSWIVLSQYTDPPLYHLFASLPVRLFPAADVITQMYLMRIISLGFFLLSILAAWGTAKQIDLPDSTLLGMIPLFLALLPGYVELMTAINNDSAAIAIASLFVWFSLRCIRRRGSWLDIALMVILIVLAYFTKKTVWFIALFLPFVLVLSFVHPHKRWFVWGGAVTLVICTAALVFEMGDAGDWYRMTDQAEFTRAENSTQAVRPHSIQVVAEPGFAQPPSVWQHLPLQSIQNVDGKIVTIGGWMWSSHSVGAAAPGLQFFVGNQVPLDIAFQQIEVVSEPKFFHYEVQVPKETRRILVSITPFPVPPAEKVAVYYSGLFLIEGQCTDTQVPTFVDSSEQELTWCSNSFKNLIRNGSAARAWPVLKNEVAQFFGRWIPFTRSNPTPFLGYLLDRQGNEWYDVSTITNLFRSFWARFGWGHVPLLGSKPYRLLFFLSWFMALGGIMAFVLERNALLRKDKHLTLYLVLFGLAGWFIGMIAGIYFSGLTTRITIPVARFAYVAIIPTAFFLVVGWWEWFGLLGRGLKSIYQTVQIPVQVAVQNLGIILYLILFVFLNIYALISILYYYHWS